MLLNIYDNGYLIHTVAIFKMIVTSYMEFQTATATYR